MEALKIKKHIMSMSTTITINIPEFQNHIGKQAEIIILIENTTELDSQFVFKPENSEKGITAKEIMQLPVDKKKSIIAKQFKEAIALYDENPELIIEDVDS